MNGNSIGSFAGRLL